MKGTVCARGTRRGVAVAITVFTVTSCVLLFSIGILAGVTPLSHVNSVLASGLGEAETQSTVPPPVYSRVCERKATSDSAMVHCVDSQIAQLNGEMRSALTVEATYLGGSGVTETQSRWLGFLKSDAVGRAPVCWRYYPPELIHGV